MNEPQLWKKEFAENPNRLATKTYGDETPVEAMEIQPIPKVAEVLGIQNLLDSDTFNKAQAVEDYIANVIQKENLREGIGYKTVFQRLIARLPEPLEFMVRNGQARKALDIFFQEAAIFNKSSSETFLKKVSEDVKHRRISTLLAKLDIELANL